MRIATWNVNSIRMRLQHVLDFINEYRVDTLLMQEIKCTNEVFPFDTFKNAGFNCIVFGQKAYNGVAVLSRYQIEDVHFGNSIFETNEARYIDGLINSVRIVCIYVPNGQEVGTANYWYKLRFFDILIDYLSKFSVSENIIIGGDFNVTRSDYDVWNPQLWHEKICCSSVERDKFQKLLDLGYKDIPRKMSDTRELFTWWDYRHNGYKLNHGLRLDYILTSEKINVLNWERCIKLRQLIKPSDHIPVLIDI